MKIVSGGQTGVDTAALIAADFADLVPVLKEEPTMSFELSDRPILFDFESFLFDTWHIGTSPVCCGAVQGAREWILRCDNGEAYAFFIEAIESNATLVAFNAAFDAGMLMSLPEADYAFVQLIIQAYEDGKILCARNADKITAIATGSYRRRMFSLAASYKEHTGLNVLDSKGGDHPIIGAFRGAANQKRLEWLNELRKYTAELVDGTLSGEGISSVPLLDTPWRYKYPFLLGLPVSHWPAEAKRYVTADCREAGTVLMAVSDIAASLPIPPDAQGCPAPAPHLEAQGYLESSGLPLGTAFESAADFALTWMGEVGFFVRQDYVRDMRADAEATRSALEDALLGAGLLQVRKTGEHKGTLGMDTKAVQGMVRAAFLAAGLVPPLTKKGEEQKLNGEPPEQWAVKRSASVLAECPGRLAEAYRVWQECQRLCDIQLPILERSPIRTRYNSIIITGRSSSGASEDAGREINSQNQKKDGGLQQAFRRPTVAEYQEIRRRLRLPPIDIDLDDFVVIIDCDYPQQELFTASTRFVFEATGQYEYMPGVSALADALYLGKDIHSMIAAEDFRLRNIDDFALLGEHEAYSLFCRRRKEKVPHYVVARQSSKAIIYGALGMMGAAKLAMQAFSQQHTKMATHPNGMWDVEGSIRVAARLLEICLRLFPDVAQHRQRYYSGDARQTGIAMPSLMLRGGAIATEAGNFVIQPEAAKISKGACFDLVKAAYDPDGPARSLIPFIFVHDSIGSYCLHSDIERAAPFIEGVMRDRLERSCPGLGHRAELIAIPSETIEKDGKRTYDEEGRLTFMPTSRPVAVRHPHPWSDHPLGVSGWLYDISPSTFSGELIEWSDGSEEDE